MIELDWDIPPAFPDCRCGHLWWAHVDAWSALVEGCCHPGCDCTCYDMDRTLFVEAMARRGHQIDLDDDDGG